MFQKFSGFSQLFASPRDDNGAPLETWTVSSYHAFTSFSFTSPLT